MNTPALLLLGRDHSELYVLHWFLEFSHGISGLITHYLGRQPFPILLTPSLTSSVKGSHPTPRLRICFWRNHIHQVLGPH